MKGKYRLRVLEKIMMKKLFGPKNEEVKDH
jgi:hypothetical protein